MNVVTHKGNDIYSNDYPYFSFRFIVNRLNIRTTRAESFLNQTNIDTVWQYYANEVIFYHSIAEAPFYIVPNDNSLNEEQALQISYAMLKNRPIIVLSTIRLTESVTPFLQEVITKHLHRYHAFKLSELELSELSILLGKLKSINYSLSKSEKILIKSRIKAHFRNLAKKTH